MPNPILYHNPRCSKSRQALAFLNDQHIVVEVVEYLKTPLSVEQLNVLYHSLKATDAVVNAIDMVRSKELEFSLAGLSVGSSDSEVINAIARSSKLLERPILYSAGLAAIGRPLENIKAILND
jgi:arsenate reductase